MWAVGPFSRLRENHGPHMLMIHEREGELKQLGMDLKAETRGKNSYMVLTYDL